MPCGDASCAKKSPPLFAPPSSPSPSAFSFASRRFFAAIRACCVAIAADMARSVRQTQRATAGSTSLRSQSRRIPRATAEPATTKSEALVQATFCSSRARSCCEALAARPCRRVRHAPSLIWCCSPGAYLASESGRGCFGTCSTAQASSKGRASRPPRRPPGRNPELISENNCSPLIFLQYLSQSHAFHINSNFN